MVFSGLTRESALRPGRANARRRSATCSQAAGAIVAVLTLALGACTTAPPPADTSLLSDPNSKLMAPVAPLIDPPKCKGLEGNAWLECRATYDAGLRVQCVGYAERVIGWQDFWAELKGKASAQTKVAAR